MTDDHLRDEAEHNRPPMTRRELRARERAAEAAKRARVATSTAGLPIVAPTTNNNDDHSQASPYFPEQNRFQGDVDPFPADQREYPEEAVTELNDDALGQTVTDISATPLLVGYQTVGNGQTEPDPAKIAARRRKRRRRNMVMLATFGVFVILITGVVLGISHILPSGEAKDYPGPGGNEVEFTVNPGEGPIVIGNRLVAEDIVGSTTAFMDALETVETTQEIQPGDYVLREQMPAIDAAERLLRVGESGVHYVAVNSGTRIGTVYESIADVTEFSVEEIAEAAADPTVFGVPDAAPTLEGYIAAGEYRFPIEATIDEILQQMIDPTLEHLGELGIDDPEDQHRLVTIASIVQAESRPEDYRTVAGIIENRLQPNNTETNGYLQIDATLIYGLDVQRLQFTAEERADASNEYNTYAHPGLTPGAIGAPSSASLDAAADPEDNDYYYWITVNIETGETHFSRTLAEHRVWQQEYRQYCEENAEICGG